MKLKTTSEIVTETPAVAVGTALDGAMNESRARAQHLDMRSNVLADHSPIVADRLQCEKICGAIQTPGRSEAEERLRGAQADFDAKNREHEQSQARVVRLATEREKGKRGLVLAAEQEAGLEQLAALGADYADSVIGE